MPPTIIHFLLPYHALHYFINKFIPYYYKKKKNLLRSIWDKILFLFVYLPAAARSAASSIFFLGDYEFFKNIS